MKFNWGWLLRVLVLILLYLLLGNARSIQENPFIPGAVIAVNMIIPVIAGILFGKWAGLAVGIFGTFLNSLTPAGSFFEFLSVLPHGVMGFSAGHFKGRFLSVIVMLSLVIGHILNIIMFISFKVMPITLLLNVSFWLALAYEIFTGAVAIIVIVALYRICFEGKWH